ncbi:ATP synthase subunit I [Orrella sp. JC864]|uniref:ATP synthase subunit I n=1 Tax=Orrella sp. JC864 TaxID=3120298 RepID=UPI0030097449
MQSGLLGTTRAQGRSVVLQPHERAALNARAGRGLVGALIAQGVLALVAAGVSWAIAGTAAGLSALAGAGAYFIPNTLFALRLLLDVYRPGGARPYAFLLGEMLKIGMAVVLLWVTVRVGADRIVWPALLAGLFSAMKGYVLLLMFRRL